MEAAGGRVWRSEGVSARKACAAMPRRSLDARHIGTRWLSRAAQVLLPLSIRESDGRTWWRRLQGAAPAGGTNDAEVCRKRRMHVEMYSCHNRTNGDMDAAQDKPSGLQADRAVGFRCRVASFFGRVLSSAVAVACLWLCGSASAECGAPARRGPGGARWCWWAVLSAELYKLNYTNLRIIQLRTT